MQTTMLQSQLKLGIHLLRQQTCMMRHQIPACCCLAQRKIALGLNHVNVPHRSNQQTMRRTPCFSTSATCKVSAGSKPIHDQYKDMEFTVFYRLPSIQFFRLLSRMKIYQTAAAVLAIPPVTYLYSSGAVTGTSVASSGAVACFAGFMLVIMSHYFRRLIGLMSLSDCGTILRISHLTFWGKRSDIYVPVESVVPLGDLPDRPDDVYIKLKRYDTEDCLYYTLRWGHIQDIERFSKVLGKIDVFVK